MSGPAVQEAADSIGDLESPLYEQMLYAVMDAVRPELTPEDAVEDLIILAKQDVPFADMIAPIPAGYDGYLSHLYSKRYMELLPIDSRVSGHLLARVDLGDIQFPQAQGKTRHVDIRGELYEKEINS